MTEENATLVQVDFTCQYCGGQFIYRPTLMGAGVSVGITVQRIGDECISHAAYMMTGQPGDDQ